MKCWVALKSKDKTYRRQGFADTFEALAQTLIAISSDGRDAYFACAAFKDASSRRGHNAQACKAFWADIDCGEGKPYGHADAGISAVDEFANRLDLPLPLVVHSGRGIHAYWPLANAISAEEWTATARNLKHAAQVLGLHADPSRTADISSILRPPGTLNYKHDTPERVSAADEYESITGAEFARLTQSYAQPATRLASAAPVPVISSIKTDALTAAIIAVAGGAPSMTQGYGDGARTQELARRAGWLLAKGHGVEDVLAQCRAWNLHNQPPKDDAALEHDVRSYAKRETEKRTKSLVPVNIGAFPFSPPVERPEDRLPPIGLPFKYGVGGVLMFQQPQTDEEISEGKSPHAIERVSHYPIFMDQVAKREHAEVFTYVFQQWLPGTGWYQFLLDAGDCVGNQAAVLLAHHGAVVNMKYFKGYMHMRDTDLKSKKLARQYEQFGWKDNYSSFLIGSSLIGAGGQATYAYGDTHLSPRMKMLEVRKDSSLDAWSSAANKLYAPGFEAMGFALLASFAAPLITFICGNTDGGAILALFSRESGHGKSKMLEAIASVWGQYDAFSISGKDTINSMFSIISRACHLPVYEEELVERDPFMAADRIKAFTVGRDKNRAQRDGAVAVNHTRYQTIMISASNRSVYELVKQSGDEGAVARVFELTIERMEKEEAKHFRDLADTMLMNCGHAGRAFIYALMQPGVLPWVRDSLKAATDKYIEELETKPEHRFIVWIMAACRVAAEVVNAAHILSFEPQRILNYGKAQAISRICDHVASGSSEMLGEFINEFANSCLTVAAAFHPKKSTTVIRFPTNKNIVMRMEKENQRLYISTYALTTWLIDQRRDIAGVQKQLVKDGVLLNPKRMTMLSAGTDLPPSRVLCWEIDVKHPLVTGVMADVAMLGAGEEQRLMRK